MRIRAFAWCLPMRFMPRPTAISINGWRPTATPLAPTRESRTLPKSVPAGGDKGWVRKELIATALGDPPGGRGQTRDPNVKRINNGIQGDGRRSTAELGKRIFDLKVDYAVRQIHQLLGPAGSAAQ